MNPKVLFIPTHEEFETRTKLALKSWEEYRSDGIELPIVISGSHNGKHGLKGIPESHRIRNYLLAKEVPQKVMHVEDKSTDTLGNFILSTPLLRKIKGDRSSLDVDLFVDKSHGKRTLWTGRKVLDPCYSLTLHETNLDLGLIYSLFELPFRASIYADLKFQGLKPGDEERFLNYLNNDHPLHAQNPPVSCYKFALDSYKVLLACYKVIK
jgi:hypothetical protein